MNSNRLKRQAVIDMALAWQGPMRAVVAPPAKKRIGIEALLTWAYRDELPKVPRLDAPPAGFRGAWDRVAEWVEEMSLAGLADNRYGVVPDFLAQDLPHNDAMIVHDAVCGLDDLEVDGLAELSPFDGCGDADAALLADYARSVRSWVLSVGRDGKARLRRPLRNLIFHHAVLGGAPHWEITPFEADFERWPQSGEVMYFRHVRQWVRGAFGDVEEIYEVAVTGGFKALSVNGEPPHVKPVLRPDPTDEAVERVHYELWRLALDVLAADLSGRLEKFEVVACGRPLQPWREPVVARGRMCCGI